MPVQECQLDGKPGFKWGQQGKCYTYNPNDESSKNKAKDKALTQGMAQHASENKKKK